jgi:hypothetical protein
LIFKRIKGRLKKDQKPSSRRAERSSRKKKRLAVEPFVGFSVWRSLSSLQEGRSHCARNLSTEISAAQKRREMAYRNVRAGLVLLQSTASRPAAAQPGGSMQTIKALEAAARIAEKSALDRLQEWRAREDGSGAWTIEAETQWAAEGLRLFAELAIEGAKAHAASDSWMPDPNLAIARGQFGLLVDDWTERGVASPDWLERRIKAWSLAGGDPEQAWPFGLADAASIAGWKNEEGGPKSLAIAAWFSAMRAAGSTGRRPAPREEAVLEETWPAGPGPFDWCLANAQEQAIAWVEARGPSVFGGESLAAAAFNANLDDDALAEWAKRGLPWPSASGHDRHANKKDGTTLVFSRRWPAIEAILVEGLPAGWERFDEKIGGADPQSPAEAFLRLEEASLFIGLQAARFSPFGDAGKAGVCARKIPNSVGEAPIVERIAKRMAELGFVWELTEEQEDWLVAGLLRPRGVASWPASHLLVSAWAPLGGIERTKRVVERYYEGADKSDPLHCGLPAGADTICLGLIRSGLWEPDSAFLAERIEAIARRNWSSTRDDAGRVMPGAVLTPEAPSLRTLANWARGVGVEAAANLWALGNEKGEPSYVVRLLGGAFHPRGMLGHQSALGIALEMAAEEEGVSREEAEKKAKNAMAGAIAKIVAQLARTPDGVSLESASRWRFWVGAAMSQAQELEWLSVFGVVAALAKESAADQKSWDAWHAVAVSGLMRLDAQGQDATLKEWGRLGLVSKPIEERLRAQIEQAVLLGEMGPDEEKLGDGRPARRRAL